jgi:hypothetical protein
MVNDPWGTEGRERVIWYFGHPSYEAAEMMAEGVLLVPVEYKDGTWREIAEEVTALPCPPPSPVLTGPPTNPLVMVTTATGEPVLRRNLPSNPRIVLREEPTGDPFMADVQDDVPYLLKETTFTLRLPLVRSMAKLEFYETPASMEAGAAADLTVDLTRAVQFYAEAGGPVLTAPCEAPQYRPDALAQ